MKDNEDLIKWNKQSEKDLYKEASSTWNFNQYLCILKNGKFALATSICDEGADGSVSCWFEFCDEELDEQYYVDDIEYWVLLEKPKGEIKRADKECWKECEYANPKSEIISAYLVNKKENEQLKAQLSEFDKQYETCPYRSTDMGCDYCDYRNRNLKDEVINDR